MHTLLAALYVAYIFFGFFTRGLFGIVLHVLSGLPIVLFATYFLA